jgi:hypothetical protein
LQGARAVLRLDRLRPELRNRSEHN